MVFKFNSVIYHKANLSQYDLLRDIYPSMFSNTGLAKKIFNKIYKKFTRRGNTLFDIDRNSPDGQVALALYDAYFSHNGINVLKILNTPYVRNIIGDRQRQLSELSNIVSGPIIATEMFLKNQLRNEELENRREDIIE